MLRISFVVLGEVHPPERSVIRKHRFRRVPKVPQDSSKQHRCQQPRFGHRDRLVPFVLVFEQTIPGRPPRNPHFGQYGHFVATAACPGTSVQRAWIIEINPYFAKPS
uniref:(northern house mosquito) hypothetical protein n=1 Tax=Culex pipiens TaxID=7175 RepID=A0A8D8BPJ5_CULPI